MTKRGRPAVQSVARAVIGWNEDDTVTWGWMAQAGLLVAYAPTRAGALLKLRQYANEQAFVERKAAAIERERKLAEDVATLVTPAAIERALSSLPPLVAGMRGQGQHSGQIRAPIPRASRQRTRGGKGKSKRGGRA